MSTNGRLLADDLYKAIEEMLFLAANPALLHSRQESNRLKFIDAVEKILNKLEGSES